MAQPTLYPLRFTPIYQYRLWGGRRLSEWLADPLPGNGPIGEAWLLSDRDDHPSRVADGPLKGCTIAQLIEQAPRLILGQRLENCPRFPVLLKFLDVQKMLSVQVHPADGQCELIPRGETGKTEAWVVLEAGQDSRIYAGLQPAATKQDLSALSKLSADSILHGFRPERGQAIPIDAGIVHSLGNGVVVFEIQQNSDVTYRLYDWNHIDPETGHRRALQVDQALACVDLDQGPVRPVPPLDEVTQPYRRERLFDNPHFRVWRLQGEVPFPVGAMNEPRVLVCLGGSGHADYLGAGFAMERGTVMLLPAAVGQCLIRPANSVTVLDIAVPVRP